MADFDIQRGSITISSATTGTITAGVDYTATPSFTNGVTYNATAGTIDVPAGVSSFDVTFPAEDNVAAEPASTADQSSEIVTPAEREQELLWTG